MRWLALAATLAACGSHTTDQGSSGAAGRAVGAGLAAAMQAAADTVEPWRCARIDDLAHATRKLEAGKKEVTIAVVTGAHGAGDTTVAALAAVRKLLDAAPVDLVISLGGMGGDRDEIARALAPLADGAPWPVLAIPSDREPIGEHRAAIAQLASHGDQVLDGSDVRLVELGSVAIATLPGEPFAERLGGGANGCLRDDEDAAAILAALHGHATTILAVMDPPRGADDLAPGGVHAGDLGLARALAGARVDLVIHAAVDDAPGSGAVRRGTTGFAAAGAIDATPRYRADGGRVLPSALLVTVGERDVAWKPLAPRVVP